MREVKMSYNTFWKWQAIMGGIIGGVTGAFIGMGNWMVIIITVIICVSIMIILRRRVKEIVADERTHTIAGKAARMTLQIVAIGMAMIGAILLVVSRGESPALTQTGFTLEYTTCALLVINYVAYYYYSKRLGGR
jgi:uncharacterized membrane protein